MALEAWEIVVIVIVIILLLKPSVLENFARSLGKIAREYKRGRTT